MVSRTRLWAFLPFVTFSTLAQLAYAGQAHWHQFSERNFWPTQAATASQPAPNTTASSVADEKPYKKPPVGNKYIYKVVNGRELHLWVLEPAVQDGRTLKPAIVFYHGGGFVSGGPSQFNYESKYFASRGLVAVQVEYRLLPLTDKTILPTDCIEDAKSAMRWVRSHAGDLGIDPNRIATAGGSAGGYLAAFMGTVQEIDAPGDDLSVSAKPDAIILFNGVIDNGPNGWGYERFGDRYKELSPAFNATSATPPTLSMSGTDDTLITPSNVKTFQEAMKKAGARCDVVFYPGQQHGFFNDQPFAEKTTLAADEFLTSLGWLQKTSANSPIPSSESNAK